MTFVASQFDDGGKDGYVKYRILSGSQFHEVSIHKKYVDNWTEEQLNEAILCSFYDTTNIIIKK